MSCSPWKVNQRSGGTCRLHLQVRILNQQEAAGSAYYLRHAGVLPGLFFDPEDGGDMFLGKVD
jgi:hypothetical protein